jgi:hypothetical protein
LISCFVAAFTWGVAFWTAGGSARVAGTGVGFGAELSGGAALTSGIVFGGVTLAGAEDGVEIGFGASWFDGGGGVELGFGVIKFAGPLCGVGVAAAA